MRANTRFAAIAAHKCWRRVDTVPSQTMHLTTSQKNKTKRCHKNPASSRGQKVSTALGKTEQSKTPRRSRKMHSQFHLTALIIAKDRVALC